MNFEPQKLFIGMMDFFSILLPGALLTFVIKQECEPTLFRLTEYPPGTQGWVIFLFSSYLLGHFVFLIGSWVLDEMVYKQIREGTDAQQIKRLANGKNRSFFLFRWMATLLVKADADEALKHALCLKDLYLEPLIGPKAINAFQWSKAKLALEHESVLTSVQRFEADSKFFRSFVIVLVLLIFPFMKHYHEHRGVAVSTLAALAIIAFCRYLDQRVKATSQAYWYIITLEANKGQFTRLMPQPLDVSHAGGIVIRWKNQRREYLLVQASEVPHLWVLPKGHIENLESARQTAVREVLEETGVWANITQKLSISKYRYGDQDVSVQFYLMQALSEGKPKEGRQHEWVPYNEAIKHTEQYPEATRMLEEAERAS